MQTVTVLDADGRKVTIEVTDEVFLIVDDERRELEREKKEKFRHRSKSELKEDLLPRRLIERVETPEDQVCFFETLRGILDSCTSNQRTRFALYISGYSWSEIARRQRCTVMAVKFSVMGVLEKIKKVFGPL